MRHPSILVLLSLAAACSCRETPAGGRGAGGAGGAGGSGGTQSPGSIVGEVLLIEGGPAAGAEVSLDGVRVGATDMDGAYGIEGTEPGTHTLTFTLPPRWPESLTVDVRPGVATVPPVVELRDVRRVGAGQFGVPWRTPPAAAQVVLLGEEVVLWRDDIEASVPLLAPQPYMTRQLWSDDGLRVAVYPNGGGPLVVHDLVTSTTRSLGVAREFFFAPDRDHLLFTDPSGNLWLSDLRTEDEPHLLCEGLESPWPDLDRVGRRHVLCRSPEAVPGWRRWDLVEGTFVDFGPDVPLGPRRDHERDLWSAETDTLFFLAPTVPGAETSTLWVWSADAGLRSVLHGIADWYSERVDGLRAFAVTGETDGGHLLRLDLATGTAAELDTGVSLLLVSEERPLDHFFYTRGYYRGPLDAWDDVRRTVTRIAPAADPYSLQDAWPVRMTHVAPATGEDPGGLREYRFDTGEVTDLGNPRASSAARAGVVVFDGEANALVVRRDDGTDTVPTVGDLAWNGAWSASPSLDRLVYGSEAGVGAWTRGHPPYFVPNATYLLDEGFGWVVIGANDTGLLVAVDLETGEVQHLGEGCFHFEWSDELGGIAFQAGCTAAGSCADSRLDAWDPASREVWTLADLDGSLQDWWMLPAGRVITAAVDVSGELRAAVVDRSAGVTLALGTLGDTLDGLRFSDDRVLVLDEGELVDGLAALVLVELDDLSMRVIATDVEPGSLVTVPSDQVGRPTTFAAATWKQATNGGELWVTSLDGGSTPRRVERGPAAQLGRSNVTEGFAFYSLPADDPHAGVWALPLPR